MAYRRRRMLRGKKRRGGRRKAARSVVATKAYVRKQIRKDLEVKCHTTETDLAYIDGTLYSHHCYDNIIEGLTGVNRIGREIRAIGSTLAMVVRSDTILHTTFLRVLFVLQKEEGLNDAGVDFFKNSSTDAPMSFSSSDDKARLIRPINRQKFQIKYDRTFRIDPKQVAAGGGGGYMRVLKFPMQKLNNKIMYDQAGAGGYQASRPQYKWLWFVEHAAATINSVSIQAIRRDYFVDP